MPSSVRQALTCLVFFCLLAEGAYAGPDLPRCGWFDSRVPVEVWKSDVSVEAGKDPKLSSLVIREAPPAGDGKVVFLELYGDNEQIRCSSKKADELYVFTPEADAKAGMGLQVNVRGHVQFTNGSCYFSGFYMNERVFGMHQGWIETYYGPLDKFQVISSGKFCLKN